MNGLFTELIGLSGEILLWGLVGTVTMSIVLYASPGLGLSRLSLPLLFGTFFTGHRGRANIIGFVTYALGGWLFAYIYVAIFLSMRFGRWWFGALLGFGHGLFLLTVMLPLLPYVHPRLASEFDGPLTSRRRLEPPGFLGLNYGYRTPAITLLAQTLYGAIVGLGFQMGALSSG